MTMWGGRADCQKVGQAVRESGSLSESRADCQKSGRLSESRADCQRVGQTVRELGRLSESRADCQKVWQAVRESGRLSDSRADCLPLLWLHPILLIHAHDGSQLTRDHVTRASQARGKPVLVSRLRAPNG